MDRVVRKYGITVFAVAVAATMFTMGFAFGRGTASAQPTHASAQRTETTAKPAEQTEASGTETTVPRVEVKVYTEVVLTATAYCPCEKCCGKWARNRPIDDNGETIVYTASGAIATAGRTVAADTSVFPFGTVLIVDGVEYVVEDRGGAIKGNRIDVYFDTHEAALDYGRQTVTALIEL